MKRLYNEEIKYDEKYDRSKYISCRDVYDQLFPNENIRTRQRDFQTLCRIGYPIRYNRKIQYYEFYDNGVNRAEFGVFREDGRLKRELGVTDFEKQVIPWDVIEYPEYIDDDYEW